MRCKSLHATQLIVVHAFLMLLLGSTEAGNDKERVQHIGLQLHETKQIIARHHL